MNKVFNKLPFPVKLFLIGLIPTVFLIYFAFALVKEKTERLAVVESVQKTIHTNLAISALGNELIQERRTTFRYYLEEATEAELVTQRAKTDALIQGLKKELGQGFDSFANYTLLNQLSINRPLFLRKQLSVHQVINYYTNLLVRFNNSTNVSIENIPYLDRVSHELIGQRLMSELVNQFGTLRNQIFLFSYTRQSNQLDIEAIQRNHALVLSYWAEYQLKSPASSTMAFQRLENSEEAKYLNGVLDAISRTGKIPAEVDPNEWWRKSGIVLDKIANIQSNLMGEVQRITAQVAEEEEESLHRYLFFLAFILIITIVLIFYTTKNISDILLGLKENAERIARGATGTTHEVKTEDAIGSLSKSIRLIDVNNLHLAEAAAAIGQGNFNVSLTPRSNDDVLGNALLKMKEDLMELSRESNEKIWIQSGVSLLNESVIGEKAVETIAKDALNALVNFLSAEFGLFYVYQEGNFQYSAGYAVPVNHRVPTIIAPGETLLGQAAIHQQIKYFQKIPDDFVKISSGSGESKPQHLYVVPLLLNQSVEGIIEIGSIQPFPPSTLDLLEEVSRTLAITLHTAKNRARVQELLEETQAQAEELQAQHSELENINTELEVQSSKLQASEEELKVQQEELLQANQELEERSKMLEEKNQLIVERNLDIQKKAEELEQSTRYKSEFLANMSHELRTPLNSILLLSRLMAENVEENLTDDQIEYAKVIQSSGNGLLTLIDEILDLSKIEAGKMDLEFADTYIKDVTDDLRALFAPIAREKNLEFKINVIADVPGRIVTDKMRLEQILKNLISNALKFTPKGYVELRINPAQHPDYIQLSVKDTGIGIPEEKQEHIFEAFQQADGSTKRRFGGTGLGLSISRQLAKLLGGEIVLKSKAGEGSEFIVTIPVAPLAKPSQESVTTQTNWQQEVVEYPATPAPALPIRHIVPTVPQQVPDDRDQITETDKSILIIEDDTNFVKALMEFTRKSGYKCLVAVRGDDGIELAKTFKPRAILLDIQLPVKDGWEVMEELKSNTATRHIPVHMMSSLEMKKESLIKGAVDFINKPIAIEQMQEMFRKLEDALNRHPKKVLIVEENPKHAQALSYFLSSFNVISEIKGSVDEGVETLMKKEVDCVILDMGIPDHAAYETLEAVKKNKGLENLPIIIFTGKNLSKAEEGRLKQYADSIVMKTAHSYQRILDEVALFLHLVEEKSGPDTPNRVKKNLLALSEVLKNKTVLVADDDVRNIFSLTKALEQHKMNVLSATDGKEALRILDEHPEVDIVLMDMMMPEMDGYETTSKIRQNPKYKNLPVLAVTAKAMIGDREKCIRAGASDYISKPVDVDQLISLLRVWLYDKHF
ncbi:response regulator [Pedobacter sp. SYSU D00535]|uniref:response regulator n=1 Tax=Pedobacter sp. SYSU D00535 TaxID=2810308 RepID=UPI001A95E705|nr:response regulator [Pedobacter sp. SYSU D00535]